MIQDLRRNSIYLVMLFLITAVGYSIGFPYQTADDNIPNELLPVALIKDHSLYLDGYFADSGELPYYLKRVGERTISAYSVVPALLNFPVYAVAHKLGYHIFVNRNRQFLSKITSLILASLTVLFLYLSLERFCRDQASAFLLALAAAFGTSLWSLISTGIWKQSASLLFMSIGLYLILCGSTTSVALAGFFCSFSFVVRPLTLLLSLPLFFYLAVHKRRQVRGFILGGLFPLLFMFWYSYAYMGFKKERVILSKLTFGYISPRFDDLPVRSLLGDPSPDKKRDQNKEQTASWSSRRMRNNRDHDEETQENKGAPGRKQSKHSVIYRFLIRNGLTHNFLIGLAGILVSPGRGLFVFSPFLIFSFIWLIKSLVYKKGPPILRYMAASVMLFLLVIASYERWWGGWTFGYRLLVEAIPFLLVFLMVFWMSTLRRNSALMIIFLILLFWSIFVHFLGVYYYPSDFNFAPDNIDLNPSRLWNITGSEVFRLIEKLAGDDGSA